MCKLCDEIRPKGWNFCAVCGKELRVPRYNLDATFKELLEQAAIEPKAVLDYLKDK